MPDSELAQFAADLHQEVLQRSGVDAALQLREEAFTEHVLELLAEHNEADGAEVCSYEAKSVGRTPAAKLNAYGLSGDGATLDLFVTLYHGTGEAEEIGLPEARRHFQLLRGFLSRVLDGFHTKMEEASDAFRTAQQIHEAKDSLTTVRLFFLTDSIVRSLEGLEQEPLRDLEVRLVFWDLDKLSRLHVGHREVIALNFRDDYGGPIPCLQTHDATGEYQTLLAFFPAPLLAQIYGQHGPRLLEKNVRSFLQVRGKVNKGIQQTLAEVPHRFLAYNNGISATASEVGIETLSGGQALLASATDFQVVNGGQTTASIFHAWKKERRDISQVVVQVKLTVASDPERLGDFVPLISLYANSQNKVNTADFSANGPLHQKLEYLSRTVWAPPAGGMERGTRWYYERARGSYLDDKYRAGTPAQVRQWEREHPLAQKFTKTDLAKFENTWDEFPHLVSRGAEKNFAEWVQRREESGWPVVDEAYFHRLVARACLFRQAERIISAQGSPGYRANIVTYSLAWLVRRSSRRLPLDGIWQAQSLSRKLEKIIDAIGHEARRHITNPPGGRNITEWCKKEQCWTEFRDSDIALPSGWERELDAEEYHTPLDTTGNAEMMAAIAVVRTISPAFWYGLAKWAKQQNHLQPWQRSLAYSLGRIASQSRPPSGKQALQGVKILEAANERGYAGPEV